MCPYIKYCYHKKSMIYIIYDSAHIIRIIYEIGGFEMSLEYAILGVLQYKPVTGYDIKKMIEKIISDFWAESNGQLYPTLNHLVEKGYISFEERKEQGKQTEYLLWVGSMGSFDNRSRKVLYELIRLLDNAEVNFAVLGVEERMV